MSQIVLDAAREWAAHLRGKADDIDIAVLKAMGEHVPASVLRPVKTVSRPRRSGKRNMSPEARQRIADAQKNRWANFRKEKAA